MTTKRSRTASSDRTPPSPALAAIQALGAQIGERLAAAKAARPAAAEAAYAFAAAALGAGSRLKSPDLLGDDDVRQWMAGAGVSESHLRQAITAARKATRDDAAAPAGGTGSTERKRRGKPRPMTGNDAAPASGASAASSLDLFGPAAVPTQDLGAI